MFVLLVYLCLLVAGLAQGVLVVVCRAGIVGMVVGMGGIASVVAVLAVGIVVVLGVLAGCFAGGLAVLVVVLGTGCRLVLDRGMVAGLARGTEGMGIAAWGLRMLSGRRFLCPRLVGGGRSVLP